MKAIHHNGQLVAFCHGRFMRLDPDIEALAPGHPERRWATALAAFACMVETGDHAGPYTADHAAEFARDVLLPVAEFVPCAGWTDAALALFFKVPVEQVRHRRAELGLTRN